MKTTTRHIQVLRHLTLLGREMSHHFAVESRRHRYYSPKFCTLALALLILCSFVLTRAGDESLLETRADPQEESQWESSSYRASQEIVLDGAGAEDKERNDANIDRGTSDMEEYGPIADLLDPRDGMYMAHGPEDLKRILVVNEFKDDSDFGYPPTVIVLVAHQPNCVNSVNLLRKLKYVAQAARDATGQQVGGDIENDSEEMKLISDYLRGFLAIVKIDTSMVDPQSGFLEQLAIYHTPSLMLLQATRVSAPSNAPGPVRDVLVFEYPSTPMSKPLDLFLGLYQAIARLRLVAWSKHEPLCTNGHKNKRKKRLMGTSSSFIYTISLSLPDSVPALWGQFGTQILSPVPFPPPFDPQMPSREKEFATSWLHPGHSDDDMVEPAGDDSLLLFGQCRRRKKANDFTNRFDDLASVLFLNRDILFATFEKCPGNLPDGAVMLFYDKETSPAFEWVPTSDRDVESLTAFVLTKATPSLMWLDRQTTAPMALTSHVKAHAILFVDMHLPNAPHATTERLATWNQTTRAAVQELKSACQRHKKTRREALVCLIVPSTDIRILTSFNVDIWTPHDDGRFGEDGDVLPTLMVADQRDGTGVKRYYLQRPIQGKIQGFLDRVWNGKEPLVDFRTSNGKYSGTQYDKTAKNDGASDAPPMYANNHGVHILSATDFSTRIIDDVQHHSLVLLYSPNCGHCKRLHTVWNELGDLVEHLEWGGFVRVAKLDVTTDEVFVDGISAEWLPDVYYFAPTAGSSAVRYDRVDEFGDGVGAVGSPLTFIKWLLNVSNLDELALLEGLTG